MAEVNPAAFHPTRGGRGATGVGNLLATRLVKVLPPVGRDPALGAWDRLVVWVVVGWC